MVSSGGVWRMRDLAKAGFAFATVRRAVDEGVLEVISRGLYRRKGAEKVHGQNLADVAVRVPNLIICLSSAAHFHGLLNEEPAEVWGAIPNQQTTPRLGGLAFRPIRWRADVARELGVETHDIAGASVRITDPVRTAVDMLRMVKTVGEQPGLDCLRALVDRGVPVSELEAVADALGEGKATGQYLRAYWHLAGERHEDRRRRDSK